MAPTSLKAGLLLLSQLHLTRAIILAPRQQTFESLNPDVSWPNPVVGQNYCVVDTVSSAPSSSSPSSQSSTRSSSSALPAKTSSTLVTSTRASTTSSSTTSDQPQQTGTGANCNNFYLVQPGDSCPAIESEFGISMSQFIAWNPSVNTGCTNIIAGYYYCNLAVGSSCVTLDVGYYVCVDAIDYTPPKTTTATTTTKKTSTTSSGNGIITPTPFETGMVNNFKKFYLVKSGDSCATTATSQETTATNIEKWNPGVGSLSMTLWLDDYICVSV
ncbi:hypothetical protein J3F84DRAFT_348976 [Trichoderma pleuroticola]